MTEYEAALAPYVDEDGLVCERPNSSAGPDTGNGIRELCIAEIIRQMRRESSRAHVMNFVQVISSCQVAGYPGLFSRGPRKTEELISHDDYRALSCASYLYHAKFAWEIDAHGRAHWGSFNNLAPGEFTLRTWHGRFPGLLPLYRLNAQRKLCFVNEPEISLSLLLGAGSKNPNVRILAWFTVLSCIGRVCTTAIFFWLRGLARNFPGGMRQVFGEYYGNPEHPFARFCPEFKNVPRGTRGVAAC